MPFPQPFGQRYSKPGIDSTTLTYENEFLWGPYEAQYKSGYVISGTARDAGNTDYETILRPGLLLGKIRNTNLPSTATTTTTTFNPSSIYEELKEWDPTASDGSQYIWGVLKEAISVQSNGTNTDRLAGPIVVGGGLLAKRLIIPGETTPGIVGKSLEFVVRNQLANRFMLDDGFFLPGPNYEMQAIAGGDLLLTGYESHTWFVNEGGTLAVQLPVTPYAGLSYKFTSVDNANDNSDNITLNGDTDIVVPGNIAADTLVISAATNTVTGNGSEWIVT